MTGHRALGLLVSLASLFVGVSTVAAQSPAPADHGFVLAERATLAEPNAGTVYRYQRPDGVEVDLFVTPLPPSLQPCVAACADRAVESLSSQFARAIMGGDTTGIADTVRFAGSAGRAPPEGSWLQRGRLTAFRHGSGVGSRESYLWVFVGEETVVQVRGARPAGLIGFTALNGVVEDLVLALPSHYECPGAVSGDSARIVLIPLGFPMRRLAFLVDSTLSALGYTFDFRNPAKGLWRTTPRLAWPSGSMLEGAAEGIRPGIELVAIVAADSSQSLLALSSRPVCRVGAADGRPEHQGRDLARAVLASVESAMLNAIGIIQ